MAAMAAVLASPSCSSSLYPSPALADRPQPSPAPPPTPTAPSGSPSKNAARSHEPTSDEIEVVSQKRYPGRGRDETSSSSSALKSFGMQKKEKGLGYDLKEQQVLNGMSNESIERLVGGGGSIGELKIRSLRNAIRLLSVAADVNSRRRLRGAGEFTGGVANSHLSACSHLYLSIVYKIDRKDRASARHLLQVFWDAPYLARRNLLPDLWDQLFLPHLLHLKVWYAKEVEFISGWDGEFREQRMKALERAYNDQMDLGTYQFAPYYKEWVKLGAEAPPIPSVGLPSVAVSRNMYNSVVSVSLEQEDTADNKLLLKTVLEARGGISEAGIPFNGNSIVFMGRRAHSTRMMMIKRF